MEEIASREEVEKLPESVRLFVLAYIEGDMSNATKAYQDSHPTCKSYKAAKVQSSRMLAKPSVQALLRDELARVLKLARQPVEKRVLDFWLKRAFADRTLVVGLDGTLKLTEAELREKGLDCLIDGITPRKTLQGSWVEVKLANRDEALEKLAQYCQLIKPQDQHILLEDLRIGTPPRPDDLPGREDANRAAIAAASGV